MGPAKLCLRVACINKPAKCKAFSAAPFSFVVTLLQLTNYLKSQIVGVLWQNSI
jgi:hypothetical protein